MRSKTIGLENNSKYHLLCCHFDLCSSLIDVLLETSVYHTI